MERRRGRWQIETDGGDDQRPRPGRRRWARSPSPRSPTSPASTSSRARPGTRPAGTTTTTSSGKRVASIGTGASAIQYVPEIQPQVEQLHVFQRTAPWIVPHRNRPITRVERARLPSRFPPLQRLVRAGVYAAREALVLGFVKRPEADEADRARRAHAPASSRSRTRSCFAKVTPDYTMGCKRILPSNRWYPTLQEPNVELVTGGVREVRRNSVVGEDGVEREVDAIVFGTGFQVTDMPAAEADRAGARASASSDDWDGSPQAPPRHHGPRLPELVHAARAEHRPRAQLDGLHDRVADRLRARRPARDGRARRRGGRGQARGDRGAATPSVDDADGGHRLEHAAARAGTIDAHRPQRRDLARLDLAVPPGDRALRRVRRTSCAPRARPGCRWPA